MKKVQDEDPEQFRQDLLTIEKHARTCQRIVADLLNFSHSQKSVRRKRQLNTLVDEVIVMVASQFEKKKMKLEKDLSAEIPELLIDGGRMRQVFLNLLMNALYSGSEKGIVQISTRMSHQNRKVRVEFADNGEGIEPQVIDKIFDPFFTTKPKGTGTGLGLSVSYGIVQDHGGDILVESELGGWTRFSVLLPVDDVQVDDNQERFGRIQ